MRKILTFAAAFALFATTQAFAIAGFGAHYVMNTGSLKSSNGVAQDLGTLGSIKVEQESASLLQGLGFKLWIDLIPLVDIEGTFNVAATRYKSYLIIPGADPISLEYAPEAPYNMAFSKASPLFGVANGDISVTYPFDLPFIRPYVGAGFSYSWSIPIVNSSFTKKMLDSSPELVGALTGAGAQDPDAASDAAEKIGSVLAKTLKDESYSSGPGGHIIIGCRITVIPFIKPYVNGKYYFGGNTSSQFSQGFVLEVGGGLGL
ncbi:MAG: hypothetical protein FWC15_01865 [Fibromonadales bacterium]|nr:hypothetical protein [Fibromonadales bacterium]